MNFPHLFAQGEIGRRPLKNRIIMSLDDADHVIFAINTESEDSLLRSLKGKVKEFMAVGDAASPGNLGAALRGAAEAALSI